MFGKRGRRGDIYLVEEGGQRPIEHHPRAEISDESREMSDLLSAALPALLRLPSRFPYGIATGMTLRHSVPDKRWSIGFSAVIGMSPERAKTMRVGIMVAEGDTAGFYAMVITLSSDDPKDMVQMSADAIDKNEVAFRAVSLAQTRAYNFAQDLVIEKDPAH